MERADPGWEDPYEALLPMILAESDLAGMRRLADELGDRMSPHLADVLRVDWTAEQLTNAVVRRKAVYNAAWRFFRSYDLLLTPTLATPPFAHGLQGPPVIDGREVDCLRTGGRTRSTSPAELRRRSRWVLMTVLPIGRRTSTRRRNAFYAPADPCWPAGAAA